MQRVSLSNVARRHAYSSSRLQQLLVEQAERYELTTASMCYDAQYIQCTHGVTMVSFHLR